MARTARIALVALVLGALSFPATAGAGSASGHASVRACAKVKQSKDRGSRPVARIAPNRSTYCQRGKSRKRGVPVARLAI